MVFDRFQIKAINLVKQYNPDPILLCDLFRRGMALIILLNM